MRKLLIISTLLIPLLSCEDLLEPQPVDLLIDGIALNEAADVPLARIGMYGGLRGMAAPKVLAGDFTADMLLHNGTFSQYRELSNKDITASNATVAALWGSIYGTIYRSNFILERIDDVPGVNSEFRDLVKAEAKFIRGYSYFLAVTTYGKAPLVLTTDIETNKVIARSSVDAILTQTLNDLEESLLGLPETSPNPGFLTIHAANAALARFHLYLENYSEAALYANAVISSGLYQLEPDFATVVLTDFSDEAILEVGYSAADDPGTSGLGLNNLFVGRREIIPSNEAIVELNSNNSGDRRLIIDFDFGDLEGTDNGWSVAKYGTADENNNNIIIFRLAEMYLISAEANLKLNNLQQAEDDINELRTRANAPTVTALNLNQMEQVVEAERLYELAYEGHRWYDLKRTGRLDDVMNVFSPNWKDFYSLWPVPQREILNNPSLVGDQNPGY